MCSYKMVINSQILKLLKLFLAFRHCCSCSWQAVKTEQNHSWGTGSDWCSCERCGAWHGSERYCSHKRVSHITDITYYWYYSYVYDTVLIQLYIVSRGLSGEWFSVVMSDALLLGTGQLSGENHQCHCTLWIWIPWQLRQVSWLTSLFYWKHKFC